MLGEACFWFCSEKRDPKFFLGSTFVLRGVTFTEFTKTPNRRLCKVGPYRHKIGIPFLEARHPFGKPTSLRPHSEQLPVNDTGGRRMTVMWWSRAWLLLGKLSCGMRQATTCNGMQRCATPQNIIQRLASACKGMQHSGTVCDNMQHNAMTCNDVQRYTTSNNGMQRHATSYNGLQWHTHKATQRDVRHASACIGQARNICHPHVFPPRSAKQPRSTCQEHDNMCARESTIPLFFLSSVWKHVFVLIFVVSQQILETCGVLR